MTEKRLRPRLSPEFRACVRAHAFDVLAMLLLFVAASLLAGRVWRFPFDDEIYTLTLGEQHSALRLLTDFPVQSDVHPPLFNLLFAGLQQLGLGVAAIRIVALAMTAGALALFQLLALTWIARHTHQPANFSTRLIAVLLFGLCPLAVSQGDALRWYPLFTLLIAIFATLYLAGNGAARLVSASALGLAGSTNLLAVPVGLAFAIYRYGLQRKFRAGFDSAFWLLTIVCGSLGLCTGGALLLARPAAITARLDTGILRSVLTDVLGFFGGDALGIGHAWIVVPVVVIATLAILAAVDRRQPAAPVHLMLLMAGTAALMALAGLAQPRSFLYLAPIVALFVTLWLDRLLRAGRTILALGLAAVWIAGSVGAIANINSGTHPFKRSAVIPYRNILDFIDGNTTGRVLVLSTDPVVPWVLSHRNDGGNRCVGYFMEAGRCLVSAVRYDSVVVITGHSDKSARAPVMAGFKQLVDTATAGRQKTAKLQAGRDDDAALKSWLTGVPLSENILTVEVYR